MHFKKQDLIKSQIMQLINHLGTSSWIHPLNPFLFIIIKKSKKNQHRGKPFLYGKHQKKQNIHFNLNYNKMKINSNKNLFFNQMYKPKMIENQQDFCCSKGHKLPVVTIALDPKLSRNQRLMCTECLENTYIDYKVVGLKKVIQEIEEKWIKKMETVENIMQNQFKLIESLNNIVVQMKSHLLQQLDQLIAIIIEWIKNLKQQRSSYTQYSFFEEFEIIFLNQNKVDTTLQIQEIQKTNFSWSSKFNSKIKQFNSFVGYDKCMELLVCLELGSQKFTLNDQQEQINIQNKNQEIESLNTKIKIPSSEIIQSSHQSNFKSFNYQIVEECQFSQSELCFALAIDKDCSTLVAGCESLIKVFEFNKGIIKQIQTLTKHKDSVFTLNFMQKSKQFISGSRDKSIIIWKYQKNLWSYQQILNGHNNSIQCLVVNNNEDLIISGSEDKTIKFWIKKNEWMCQQTIDDHSNRILGLKLSHVEMIKIQQQQNNQDRIQSGKQYKRLKLNSMDIEYVCFIDNNMFTFSQRDKEQISVFEMNPNNKQFTKTRDITIKCGKDNFSRFPQQYINSKCILVSKNGEYVNLIRKQQNGEFRTEQSIHFGINCLYGVMSDDGEYLITWDDKSNIIQIRRYKEQ
ncbi:unnamed protein product [Paramecium primaurelia]|uniref:Uncharacterized protein n=1 Tax=Paramecium primaurelia TaxID=5886 RepID=A0A8S1LMP3_PARPR|nr:unnamed protein product [Paramecium primaurelia]